MTIRTRLLSSLFSVLALAAIMFATNLYVIDTQESDGVSINLAGRQRMLAELISGRTVAVALGEQTGTPDAESRQLLTKAIAAFEATQKALSGRGMAPLTLNTSGPSVALSTPSAESLALLRKADQLWLGNKGLVERVLQGDAEALPKLLANTPKLRSALNDFVFALQKEAEQKTFTLLVVQTTGTILIAVLLVLTVVSSRKSLLAPLDRLRAYAREITNGNMNAQAQGTYIGELAALKDDMTTMVEGLKQTMQEARDSQREASEHAANTGVALKEAREHQEQAKTLLNAVNGASSKAQGFSENVYAAMEELSTRIEQVNANVDIQRDRMMETATAMEEMNGTVYEVARNAADAAQSASRSKENAQTGAQGVQSAVASIQVIEKRFLKLKDTMSQLGTQAESIGNIIVTINDIADQTNLLALNAAIEAARAGDAGRGFAVVADEVRKLAEKTMTATKEVSDSVKLIQDHTRENLAAVEQTAADLEASTRTASESGKFMEEIVLLVEDTATQVESIAAASEEQSAASEEINKAVSDVTRVSAETAEGMSAAAHALMEVSGLVEELDRILRDLATTSNGSGKKQVSENDNGNGKLFEWSDSLSVKIETIDSQHKGLVNLINELHAAMRQRKSTSHLVGIVGKLKDYTVNHFDTEEKLFNRHGYPATEEHIQEHRKFVEKVLAFENDLKQGKVTVTMDVMRFLKNWLTGHINGTDKKYSKFLVNKGVR
ncbi:bacteriohemerythrin [Oleidesulfovibrio sp.]|uniref:bacteriohemerythrin n=1 Tax=Oleidesulfovibrio sp. TaxID=2909707 RepID=UPI003A8A0C2E